jgi:hypothetical protein
MFGGGLSFFDLSWKMADLRYLLRPAVSSAGRKIHLSSTQMDAMPFL